MLSWRNVICLIPHSSRGNPTRHGNISIRMLVNGHRYRGYSERTSRFQLPCIRYAKASPKLRLASHQQRTLSLASLPTILLPPVAFFGLLVALWIYKCMMMVLFQDKIIYMPYIPPFSRSEEIGIYQAQCGPVSWESKHIKSLDGTNLAICVGKVSGNETQTRQVILCYFQGNASSLPPRLPMLSSVLRNIEAARKDPSIQYVLVALSYRGYWTSTGRASQRGIELDAQALLTWVETEFGTDTKVILWGQSIGAGVASTATATYLLRNDQKLHIQGLILETPFSNIRSMLSAMYPQKWLPYGYLWPFLWNHWDSEAALRSIAQHMDKPRVLLLPAIKDEIVPASEADKLEQLCQDIGLQMERQDVRGALHTEATLKKSGQDALGKFVAALAKS